MIKQCKLCQSKSKPVKLYSKTYLLCLSCKQRLFQVSKLLQVSLPVSLLVYNQVTLRENTLSMYKQRFIGCPTYYNQKKKGK